MPWPYGGCQEGCVNGRQHLGPAVDKAGTGFACTAAGEGSHVFLDRGRRFLISEHLSHLDPGLDVERVLGDRGGRSSGYQTEKQCAGENGAPKGKR